MRLSRLFDLTGRAAIVTGGSRGLGEEIAEGLAEAGASIMIAARREQWLDAAVARFREQGFRCEGLVCDVTDEKQVEHVVSRTVEALGAIDISSTTPEQPGRRRPRKCRSKNGAWCSTRT